MAIGRISGSVLKSNLTRNGVDLAFETNLLYLDVTNSRVGIGTSEPATALHVNGDITVATNNKLRLRDSGTYINSNADGDLDIVSDGTNNDAVKITSAGGVNIDANSTSATGVINLDANYHGYVGLKDNGTTYGTFTNLNTNNFYITSSISDADIVFRGNDGGSTISPMVIDMSEGGQVGIFGSGTTVPTARLHVATDAGGVKLQVTGSSSGVTPTNDADEIFVDNVGNSGITIGSGTSNLGSIHFGDSGDADIGRIEYNHSDNSLSFYTNATKQLEIDSSGTLEATNGNTVKGQPTLGNDMMSLGFGAPNGEIKAKNSSGSPASNVDIHTTNSSGTTARVFRATHDGNIQLMSGDTVIGKFSNSSSDFVIESDVQDKDILFKGDDGGSVITPLAIDMSEGGRVGIGTTSPTQALTIAGGNNAKIAFIEGGVQSLYFNDTDASLAGYFHYQHSTDQFRLNTSSSIALTGGNVGIGTTSPTSLLHVDGASILDGVTINDNTITTNASNANLELSANGSGSVLITGGKDIKIPNDTGKALFGAGDDLQIYHDGSNSYIDDAGTGDLYIRSNFIRLGKYTGETMATFAADGGVALRHNNINKIETTSSGATVTGVLTTTDLVTNEITSNGSNANLELSANGSGVVETASSILPKTDNSVDLGSSAKRFKEGYFAAGTIHVGDQTIKSTTSGFVFSGGISTQGAQVTANDDTTATLVTKASIPNSETTIESYATSANDSVLYYVVSRDQVNNEITAQKVSTVHNNTTGFASTSHITKTGTATDMSFDASISGGSMRLRATGGSVSNSISAYKIALGDNSAAGTSGNTAIVINTDVDSVAETLDSWAHASYRGAKYFISVNDEADDELETMEVMVTHNGTDAFLTVYNNVRTGSNSLITLTADISGSNVRLIGQGSRANLNVKMHRIIISDSEAGHTGDQMAIIPATTISSSATSIDTFNVNNVNAAYYYVTGTIANGDSSIVELTVATNGTDAYITTGPTVSTEGTDQLSFTATISGDIVTISAASSSGASTTVNAYRINLKRDNELDITDTMTLSGTQTISGAKTFSSTPSINVTTDDGLNITTTENSSNAGPVINLKRNSSSVDNADYLGQIKFKGENDADQEINYAKISGKILDKTDGSEDGILEFAFSKNGSQNISGRFRSDSLQLLNETSLRVAGGHAEFGVLAGDPGGTAGYAKIYAKDESASAEMFVQDEAGNVTKISPHNEQGEWEYYSRNTKTGKVVRVNMEEMIRDIEKLTGKSYIKGE